MKFIENIQQNSRSEFVLNVQPFLKWAGGKRWFVTNYLDVFPQTFNRYIEPFLGSGAVFFSLLPEKAILSDVNPNLIEVYTAIAQDWKKVLSELTKHQKLHSQEYYYKIRENIPGSTFKRAARFIYLNRTCWNGLYRVNKLGEFNVPIGTKNSVLMSHDNFENISSILSKVQIYCQDFEKSIRRAQEGDLLFIDPPYTVKHNLNGFVKYNENIFSWEDQIRLRDAVFKVIKKGAFVIMTNANHASIKELYSGALNLKVLPRATVLSGLAKGRGKTEELLLTSF